MQSFTRNHEGSRYADLVFVTGRYENLGIWEYKASETRTMQL